MNTPFFRARCNSMLRFLAYKDKVHHFNVDEYEGDVVQQLVKDHKVGSVRLDSGYHLVVVNATPYNDDNTNQDTMPNATVLALLSENNDPEIENFVKVYRKNWPIPTELPSIELLTEVDE